jgi:hypothetical protein
MLSQADQHAQCVGMCHMVGAKRSPCLPPVGHPQDGQRAKRCNTSRITVVTLRNTLQSRFTAAKAQGCPPTACCAHHMHACMVCTNAAHVRLLLRSELHENMILSLPRVLFCRCCGCLPSMLSVKSPILLIRSWSDVDQDNVQWGCSSIAPLK